MAAKNVSTRTLTTIAGVAAWAACACGGGAEALVRRVQLVQLLPREYRDNPAAQQLVAYRLASHTFPGRLGEGGVLPPDRLSDPATFAGVGGRPLLPKSFASPDRDHYRFQFDGINCTVQSRILRNLGTLCGGYVYSAVPAGGAPPSSPSFALVSADDRIHVRTDGAVPTREDPTIDNTDPTTAADLGASNAELLEQIALSDLRQVLAAENVYFAMVPMGYVPAERLADPATLTNPPTAPLLDAYFAQPLRLGYRFQFTGGTPSSAASGAYMSWSYAAVPVDPGPKGPRAFTIFSNGGIHVTDQPRAAAESDPFLNAR